MTEEEAEYRAELQWERRELLWVCVRLPAPWRDLLRARLTFGLEAGVLAALFQLPQAV
jgi:hypothetical protein